MPDPTLVMGTGRHQWQIEGFCSAIEISLQLCLCLLQQIAATTDAAYFDASTRDDLAAAYDAVRPLERSRVGERRFTEFEEFAPPLAVAAVLLLVAEAGMAGMIP